MLSEYVKILKKRMSWKFDIITLCEFICLILIVPLVKFANPEWFVENSVVENLQLLILWCAFFVALSAKKEKKLFVFCALIVTFFIIRETNMGREYFCSKYLTSDEPCRWKSFKYGYVMELARACFALYIVFYFFKNKLYRTLMTYILRAPLFMWDIVILLLCAIGATVSEFECVDNEIMEEMFEMVMYLALIRCLWIYGRVKDFIV